MSTIRSVNNWFIFGLSVVGLLLGTYIIVLRPGIGSTLSWLGIFIVVSSSLYLLITVRVQKILSRRGWDKQSKWWAGFILLLIYTLLGLGLIAVGLIAGPSEVSWLYLFSGCS